MFKRKYKLKLSADIGETKAAEKVKQMYEERRKEIKQLMKQQRKTKREKAMVAFMAVLGMMGLMGLAMYLLIRIPLPKNPFVRLIPWAIYIFVILPIFGWLIILINNHIFKE